MSAGKKVHTVRSGGTEVKKPERRAYRLVVAEVGPVVQGPALR
jgi:hypothetical protein